MTKNTAKCLKERYIRVMHKLTACLLLLSSPLWAKPIHEAAKKNDCFAALKILRQDRSQLNARDEGHGNTPLHWAAYRGNLQMVRLLVEQGASLEATTVEGYTPLRDAVYKGRYAVVEYLLEHGARTGVRDRQGATLLHWAAAGGSSPYGLKIAADVVDQQGLSPADWAAENGHAHEATSLLVEMIQLDRVDKVGAFLKRHPEMLEARLFGKKYLTPLCFARSAEMAEMLLARGAQVNALVSNDGDGAVENETPLHHHAFGRNTAVVKVLLEHGADPLSRAPGFAPLARAAMGCSAKTAALLLSWGADARDPRLLFEVGETRGIRSRSKITDAEMIETARVLLRAGAPKDVKNEKGLTPEQYARQNKNVALADFLKSGQ